MGAKINFDDVFLIIFLISFLIYHAQEEEKSGYRGSLQCEVKDVASKEVDFGEIAKWNL